MEKQLPVELINFIQVAGKIASSQGRSLYLVGGMVRDLLLRRTNLDLDLVLEGDAMSLAQSLASITQGKILKHPRFGTAKLRWDRWSVDLATARSETYKRPGSLPSVKPGSLASDLFRRDFTINAMAVEIIPGRYGELVDLYGGRDDLGHKLIRVLHNKSFTDDATRILRGLRYEQRLDFQLEATTLRLLKRDIRMLDMVSGDRIRHEIELILKEELPEKVFSRAEGLGVLTKLHPALKGDSWVAQKYEQARQLSYPNLPSVELGVALMAYRLTNEEKEELILHLRLPKSIAQTIRDMGGLKSKLEPLANVEPAPSCIYQLIYGFSPAAITTILLAADSLEIRKHIQLFLSKLRYTRPVLTGSDLLEMGIPPGPQIKEVLQRLHEARLDGKATSKQGEEDLVRRWLEEEWEENQENGVMRH
ncbi:CCA tRNA nucleotidyltransferase [Chloroflexota bacterium]